jgi:hypothetical protein
MLQQFGTVGGLKVSFQAGALIISALCLLSLASSTYGQSAPGFQAPQRGKSEDKTPASIKAARGQAPLRNLYDHLKVDPATTKRLPPLDEREKKRKLTGKALQIGAVRSLPDSIEPTSDGAVYQTDEGEVRVMAVVSEGALYTRVQFTQMSLPVGARVFVYSMQDPDEFYGPYEGHGASADGTFWTPPMKGDGVVIEYFVPKGAAAVKGGPFRVSKIAHVYLDPLTLKAGSCHNEVSAPWTETAKSVGRLDFVRGGGVGLCTGTLLADQAMDQIPYLLTANHCFSTQTEAQSLRVYWNYNGPSDILPSCPANCTDGANLLVTGTNSDFTFVRLTGTVPGGLFFSGWDAAAFSSTAASAGIHHPDGTHKRISFGNARQPTSQAECDDVIFGLQCLAVDWTSGVTEAGSSGSGIWKGQPSDPGGAKLIGTLSGGLPPDCTGSQPNQDFYGRFSVTYANISSFLSSSNCVTSVTPTNQNFSSAGGSGSLTVTAPAGCNWTAVSSSSFITITSSTSGTGNGTITFSVAPNSCEPRSGSIVVGAHTLNVTQTTKPINFGQTINADLSASDCHLFDGSFYDTYTFFGTADQQISILMTSSAFNAYLYLYRPNGSKLLENDDGGGGTNALISATLPTAGTYTILANSLSAGETGSYSLTLGEAAKRTLSVTSTNPNNGVSITVSPVDTVGLANGVTPFMRSYYLNNPTTVTLTAPATVGGNTFQKWLRDGLDGPSTTTTMVTMDVDHTMTAVYAPVIFAEEGTNNAAALDSFTFVRGPFTILTSHNFSADGHRRIILFTSDLGLTQSDLSNPATLVVEVGSQNLLVENVGTLSRVPGLPASYIVIRLPDGLPTGPLEMRVRLRGATSDARTLNISP